MKGWNVFSRLQEIRIMAQFQTSNLLTGWSFSDNEEMTLFCLERDQCYRIESMDRLFQTIILRRIPKKIFFAGSALAFLPCVSTIK